MDRQSEPILGFVREEYVSYHFWEKSLPQRLEYVSDRLRKKIGKLLNSEEGSDILNNKYLTYQALKPLYGRTIRQMNAEKGYPAFASARIETYAPYLIGLSQFRSREIELIEHPVLVCLGLTI